MYSLGASHSNRWMICAASPRLSQEAVVPESNDDLYRNIGLDDHYVGETVLKSNGTQAPSDFIRSVLPNGTMFTLDRAVAVGVYIRDVLDIAKHCSEPLQVEVKHDLSWIAPGVVARIDAAVYDRTSRHITVWDYKSGAEPRDPFHDWQMIINGLALAYQYQDAQRITLRIVQPNCWQDEPIKSWTLDIDELRQYGLQVRQGATIAQQLDAPCIAGTHCKRCRARGGCQALRVYNERMARAVNAASVVMLEDLTPQEISLELDMLAATLKTAKARREAQDAKAFSLADKQAVNVPGYKLVQKRTQRKIGNPSAFIDAARQMGYSDKLIFKEPEVLSPAKLEDVGVDKELIEMFVEKPDAGKTLAPMSDNRPATAASLLERFMNIPK